MSPNEYLRLSRLKQPSILKEGTYGVVESLTCVGFSTPPIFQAVLKNSSEYCLKIHIALVICILFKFYNIRSFSDILSELFRGNFCKYINN